MAIYKYTLNKYLKAVSTWVIVVISMVLVFILGGFVPFRVARLSTATDYAIVSVAITAAITSFLGIFTSVFAGFKSASMFKDEVEDGTFLVMLSKPISRSKIIFFKWLALQTAIIGYTFIVALSFLFAVLIFDTGHKLDLATLGIKTMRSQIVVISIMIWMILFILSLIFSSIALLLSTKLSVGTTIGISIAIGVVIPVTSLIGTFTSKPAYKEVASVNISLLEKGLKLKASELQGQLESEAPTQIKPLIDSIFASVQNLPSLTNNVNTLYGLGIATNEKDTFRLAQAFDFNYQIQKLSEFASEQATPQIVRDHLNFAKRGTQLRTVTNTEDESNPFTAEGLAQVAQLNKMLISSWEETAKYRELTEKIFFGGLLAMPLSKDVWIPRKLIEGKFIPIDPATNKEYIVLNDANKALIVGPWLSDTNKFAVALNTSLENVGKNKAVSHEDFSWAHSGLYELISQFVDNDNLLQPSPFKDQFTQIIQTTRHLFRPVDLWAQQQMLMEFQKEYGFEVHEVIHDVSASPKPVEEQYPNDEKMQTMASLIQMKDSGAYNILASAALEGHNIAKIKTVEYTSKYTILWVYLALALLLVPVSYFVIRKQDFR